MFSLTISVLLMTSCVFASGSEKSRYNYYSGRCEARCFSKTSQASFDGKCLRACLKPCMDVDNFYKVKSCTQFCNEFDTGIEIMACKRSCKTLQRLYNTGGDQGQSNVLPAKPTSTIASTLKIRKKSYVLIRWSYNTTRQDVQQPVFIIETKYYKENPYFESEWIYLTKTRATSVKITPRPGAWSSYRVMSVNEYGNSNYSNQTLPIFTKPNRPPSPRGFRLVAQMRRKDKASIKLAWSKPGNLEIPVHRYRLFWSPRLDEHTEKLHSLRVHHKKLKWNKHAYTVHGLTLNTTYQFEIQANYHHKGRRLRSQKVYLTVRTLDKAPVKPRVPFNIVKKKKIKMAKNYKTKQPNTILGDLKPTYTTNDMKLPTKQTFPTLDTGSVQGLKSIASKTTIISRLMVTMAVVMATLLHL